MDLQRLAALGLQLVLAALKNNQASTDAEDRERGGFGDHRRVTTDESDFRQSDTTIRG